MKLNNEVLAELLSLKAAIKPMLTRIAEIETDIKERGTFVTSEYAVTVKPGLRSGMASVDVCSAILGREKLEALGLIKASYFKTVSVAKREFKQNSAQI